MAALLLWIALAFAHEGAHDALARADELVAAEPGVAAHRVSRADLYRQDGQPVRALEEIEVALGLADTPQAWLVAAEAHRDLREWAAMAEAASHALPDDRAYALLAEAHAATGDPGAALDAWDAAIRLAPTPDRVLARGRLAESVGATSRAAEGYAEGIEALPGAVTLRLALLDLERRRGHVAAARAQADALLAVVPDHPEWLLLRASVQADPAAARADLERALQVLDAQIAVRPTHQREALRTRLAAALGEPR